MELKRLDDWRPRLIALGNAWRNRPYRYGESDCGCFMLAAVESVTGTDLLPGVKRPCSWIAAAKFFIERGWHNGVEDMMLELVGPPELNGPEGARQGDVVSYEEGGDLHLAVLVGTSVALTPGLDGLRIVSPSLWRKSWRIG